MPRNNIKLKRVDLTKGGFHDHPDIEIGREYLAKLTKGTVPEWFAGKFYWNSRDSLVFSCCQFNISFQGHKLPTSIWQELYLIELNIVKIKIK